MTYRTTPNEVAAALADALANKLKHNHALRTEAQRNEADKQAVPALEKAQRALQLSADE